MSTTEETVAARQFELFGYISRALVNLKKLEKQKQTSVYGNTRVESLEDNWKKFLNNHEQLSKLSKKERVDILYFKEDLYSQCEEVYLDTKAEMLTLIETWRTATAPALGQNQIVASTSNGSRSRQLPRINLPKFSGSYSEWSEFRDLFTSMVKDNSEIPAVEKLQYLKMSVTGEASLLLKNLSVTDSNFTCAWEKLIDRYENKRVLIDTYLTSLFSAWRANNETSVELKNLLNDTKDAVETLATLGCPVKHWDNILVYMTARKLDAESLKDWEKQIGSDRDPAEFSDLEEFLLSRISALEGVDRVSTLRNSRSNALTGSALKSSVKLASKANAHQVIAGSTTEKRAKSPFSSPIVCAMCSAEHFIASCPTYRNKSFNERREFVTQKRLCYNCLGSHQIRSCRSAKRCQACGEQHHTTIHSPSTSSIRSNAAPVASTPPQPAPRPIISNPISTIENPLAHTSAASHVALSKPVTYAPVLLATALVKVTSCYGEKFEVRALLDQGSEISFVTESLANRLNLPRRHVSLPINGIGAKESSVARGMMSLELLSRTNSLFSCNVNAYILDKLTSYLPPVRVLKVAWPHIEGLSLADPDFTSARRIDIVLGAETYGRIIETGVRKGAPDTPVAQEIALGWILSGLATTSSQALRDHHAAQGLQCSIDHQLIELMHRFWVQEETAPKSKGQLSNHEVECEAHFASTHSRAPDGRYIVRVPLKKPPENFGDSKTSALRMLSRQEKRFSADSKLKDEYIQFLSEYESLGHMARVPMSRDHPRRVFYLPHHAVVRESSSTTKVRVVFNGSQRSNLGISLNELQHVGPKLQTDLADVITNWRRHAYVFSADIEKMYRQILVHPDDWDLQRIVWRRETTEPVESYHLRTVTYGLASAPYLAIKTLRQLAADEGPRYPRAVDIIHREMYVDDVLSGADEPEDARKKIRDLIGILMAGGFSLQKWMSNHDEILTNIPLDKKETASPRSLDAGPLYRALGLLWQPRIDAFVFTTNDLESDSRATKRSVLSRIAQLFDPLGWIAPVIVRAKIFMQELWTIGLDWDDQLPEELATRWEKFVRELSEVSLISVPRWLGSRSISIAMELHGFSDASQAVLGAVIYLRVMDDLDDVRVTLVSAKTRVAPLKRVTIPRLELCAAVLLVRQITHVRNVLGLNDAPVHLWTDSTVTLAYIKSHPGRWADFVRNRVTEIQELENSRWHHVAGRENPADHASRGLSPRQLRDESLWWNGPLWLSKHSTSWPTSIPAPESAADLEVRAKSAATASTSQPLDIWHLVRLYSQLTKLLRITAWCIRAIQRLRRHDNAPSHRTPISTAELDYARLFWVQTTQRKYFSTEHSQLSNGKPLSRSSSLTKLSPFIDAAGMLRVGGRLKNSLLDADEKHPLILPRESALTALVIDHGHRTTLHGGTQVTLATLRRRYWILGGRVPVRAFIHRCLSCVRQRAVTSQQLMGQLPESRVSRARPFLNSGVDYAGPITLKTFRGRGAKSYKGYIILFVCFSTSAIHLELATDYSTAGFIAAYKRFTSRRGICETLASDCGTNLVGADAELRQLFNESSRELAHIADLLANDGTQWRFNPPAAPHFGEKWEASVKSVKFHLKRVIGETSLTYEEFTTFLTQVEAVLNSRPLCPLSDDPADLTALTPGHFIIGTPLNSVPEPTLIDLPRSRLSRWQLLRQMLEQYWRRWSTEYLQRLQTLSKWQREQESIKIGSLVVIKDERYPPSKWALGRVTDVHPGRDNLVRVATVRTATSTFKRPIVKLCLLPIDPE